MTKEPTHEYNKTSELRSGKRHRTQFKFYRDNLEVKFGLEFKLRDNLTFYEEKIGNKKDLGEFIF